MRKIMIVLVTLSYGLALISCSNSLTKADITSISTPLEEQQFSLWEFEKRLECENFSPCFYAIVDRALDRDPATAVKNCQKAYMGLQSLSVPSNLPFKVRNMLDQARVILQKNSKWAHHSAQFVLGTIEKPAGMVPSDAQTCDAYSLIDKVNSIYGLKALMNGQYINCSVLNSEKPPAFPGIQQLQ
jgi:hypothetical protein